MSQPVRVQLSRAKGWKMPPNTVKVDRSTRWGNPFRVGVAGVETDVEAVVTFTLMLRSHDGFWPHDGGRFAGALFIGRAEIVAQLSGKNLACWCKPGAPCHADVLLELANAPALQSPPVIGGAPTDYQPV